MTKRQQRGRAIYRNCLQTFRQSHGLLVYPAIGTLINAILVGLVIHPIYKHEFHRLEYGGAPVMHFVWFYLLIMFFFYCRNIVNGFFDAALLAAIKFHHQNDSHYLRSARQLVKRNIAGIFLWHSFMSFTGFIYSIMSAVWDNKSERTFSGGAYFTYSAIFAHAVIINESLTAQRALQRSGKLITQTWGRPPMRHGFTLFGILFKYCCIAAAPVAITGLIVPHLKLALIISGGISSVLIYVYSIYSKVIHGLIHQSLYVFASQNQVTSPFDQDSAEKAYRTIS